jgi:hypothetical protein
MYHAMPNAGAHLLPKAGAQRTLEAVRCSALFGAGYLLSLRMVPCLRTTPNLGSLWATVG